MHIPEWSQVCAETARVFGNLSRRPEIRQCFLEEGETGEDLMMVCDQALYLETEAADA